jgi:hypothetical protein
VPSNPTARERLKDLARTLDRSGNRDYLLGLRARLRGTIRPSRASTIAGVTYLRDTWPAKAVQDDPVFILSAGWRSGSTLVQRLVNSSGRVCVWGEPFHEARIVARLVDAMAAFDPVAGRFQARIADDTFRLDGLPNSWTANLTPSPENLAYGCRNLLDALFGQPARQLGARSWGIKEVTWSSDVAVFLRYVYPNARFVFLVRDPVAAWRSYRHNLRDPWYRRWSDRPVAGPVAFARLWSELADGFWRTGPVVGALLLRYEDVRDGTCLEALERHLGIPVRREVLAARIGASRQPGNGRSPRWESAVVTRITRQAAARFGYPAERG